MPSIPAKPWRQITKRSIVSSETKSARLSCSQGGGGGMKQASRASMTYYGHTSSRITMIREKPIKNSHGAGTMNNTSNPDSSCKIRELIKINKAYQRQLNECFSHLQKNPNWFSPEEV